MLWCFFSVCTSSAEGRTFFSAASVGLSFLSPSSSPLRLSLMSISLGMSLIVTVSMAGCVCAGVSGLLATDGVPGAPHLLCSTWRLSRSRMCSPAPRPPAAPRQPAFKNKYSS